MMLKSEKSAEFQISNEPYVLATFLKYVLINFNFIRLLNKR